MEHGTSATVSRNIVENSFAVMVLTLPQVWKINLLWWCLYCYKCAGLYTKDKAGFAMQKNGFGRAWQLAAFTFINMHLCRFFLLVRAYMSLEGVTVSSGRVQSTMSFILLFSFLAKHYPTCFLFSGETHPWVQEATFEHIGNCLSLQENESYESRWEGC